MNCKGSRGSQSARSQDVCTREASADCDRRRWGSCDESVSVIDTSCALYHGSPDGVSTHEKNMVPT